MASMKLHGAAISTNVMRVLACLYEKDLPFDFVPVNLSAGEHKQPSFLAINPFGQIPAFEDGDLKLFESRAITKYICDEYAEKGINLIQAEDSKSRALLTQWLAVEAHQFDTPASKLGWELAYKSMFGMTTDDAAVADAETKLGKVLDVYEVRLAGTKYLAGDTFSLADLHHLPNLHVLMTMTTRAKELFRSRPHVSAWCDDIMARPAWSKVVAMLNKAG